jgi:hypothetical protein
MSDDAESSIAAMQHALRALGRLPSERPFASAGAVLKLVPREAGLTPKDVPVDALFHKLTMMRDKLRVLEQRVNASDVTEDEKVALQAKITQLYAAFAALSAFFTDDALPAPGGA